MKTAILISGQMRTAKQCYKSIIDTLPNGDYFVHAVLDENSQDAELFSPTRLLIEPQFEQPERKEYSWQLGRHCFGVQRVLKQLHSLKRTWDIFKSSIDHYDWIIRCRPDLMLTTLLEPKHLWEGDIIIPKFCNFFGLNDRFAILNKSAAEIYFNRLDLIDEYINAGGIFHPETFLLWSCQKNNLKINRTNISFYTLRPDGNKDMPFYNTDYGDIL
jgi:hypothetical protein